MHKEIKPLLLLSAIVITTAAGVLLKYLELDTYIIILGFRFHLSCLLPFLFIMMRVPSGKIKTFFTTPAYKKHLLPLLWVSVPLLFAAAAYISGLIDISDPDYFYEFGLSSIIDYPIYLIWNLIQLFALFIFLKVLGEVFNSTFFAAAAIFVLFLYEFIFFDIFTFDYTGIILLFVFAVSGALLLKFFPNIYWFSITLFTTLWSSLLIFGTNSETLINILFAAEYNSWEGFFEAGKNYNDFLIPAYIGIFFFLLLFTSIITRTVQKRTYKL